MAQQRGFAVGTLDTSPEKIVVVDCERRTKTELDLEQAALLLQSLSLAVIDLFLKAVEDGQTDVPSNPLLDQLVANHYAKKDKAA